MAYTAPALTAQVVLSGGYTPPALTAPVVLTAETTGTLSANLPPPVLSLTLSGTGARDRNWLWTALPPPALPLVLRARERSIPVTLAVALPGPVPTVALAAAVDVVWTAHVAVALSPPVLPVTLAASISIDLALPDADGPGARIEHAQGSKTATGAALAQQSMFPLSTPSVLAQGAMEPIRVGAELRASHGLRVRYGVASPHAHGTPVQSGAVAPHTEAHRQRRPVIERHAHGLPIRQGANVPHTEAIHTRNRLAPTEQTALPITLRLVLGQQQARVTANRLHVRWTQASDPLPGRWWPRYEVPPWDAAVVLQPGYTPRRLSCPVLLSWNVVAQPPCGDPPPGPIVVPVQEVYLVINTFSLVRADTAQAVDALDFSATLDADSWTWSWSATVPASQMARVRSPALGDFVELIATLNGTALWCVVEKLGRSRQFGKAALKISGRGRAAWLAEPTSPRISVTNAETRTAQQLIDDALTDNGIPIGWTVDWQLDDWTVPAGAWVYAGTYMGAALRIAEAGGGYVQADMSAQTLHVMPYYPLAPWDWPDATPDLVLPEAVCTTEGIEWSDKTDYNAVFIVGGEHGGRRDQIVRAGSAGDVQAPAVADPLATDVAMTRQRGLRVLADCGRQALVSITLPVLAETGFIRPGALVQYTEQGQTHLGISRAVSVNWAFPKASQTVRIETHELQPV